MTTTKTKRIKNELKKELPKWEMIAAIVHGNEDMIIDFIIERYTDIMVEEIVNKGEFMIYRVLTIKSVFNDQEGTVGFGERKPGYYLKAHVSDGVKLLHRAVQNGTVEVTRDNWKQTLRSIRDGIKSNGRKRRGIYNPFIDDEDE